MMALRKWMATGTVLWMVLLYCSGMAAAADSPRIVINIAARTLSLFAGERLVKEYPIAVGQPSSPSPLGEYRVIEKIVDPWWYPTTPGMSPVPSGPENPLGYRWIGFADTYGIHGTNAPWSIGTAASKGCIRMHETDVEELFPQIAVGTPVSIIYETIRITRDVRGNVYASVHPDIYGYNTGTADRFREQLAGAGAGDLLTDPEIEELLRGAGEKPQSIGKLVEVRLNSSPVTAKGVVYKDTVYIPAAPIAQATGALLVVNNGGGTLEWQGKTVPLMRRPAGLYVGLWALQEILGMECAFDENTNTAFVEFVRVFFNGKLLPGGTQVIEGNLALPLPALLEAAGLKLETNADKGSCRIGGREIPVLMYEGVPYLPVNRIQDELDMFVHYDRQARILQLTYIPFIAGGP